MAEEPNSQEGGSVDCVIFLKYGDTTKKVARNFGSLGDLSAVLEELFDLGSDSKASDAKFSVKDKDSSNIIELSAPSDLYEGAVVTAELKDGPAEQIAKLRQQVSDLKRKLAAYEADAKSKRSNVGEKRRRVEADPPTGDGDDDTGGRIVLRLRGLPYSARESEVRDFFRGTKLVSVCLPLDGSGRPSGEGFVEVANPDDESRCMARNRGTMGRRYIEVFRSTERERTSAQNRSRRAPPPSAPPVQNSSFIGETFCIRMRGLPYDATDSAIADFFGKAGARPVRIHRKQSSGEGYAEFASRAEQERALRLHREHIGRRYVELFAAPYDEVARVVGLPPPVRSMGGFPASQAQTPQYAGPQYAPPRQGYPAGQATQGYYGGGAAGRRAF